MKVAGDEVAGIDMELKKAGVELRLMFVRMGSILWGIRCWLYTMRWRLFAWSRHKLLNTILGVLFLGSVAVVVEVALSLIRILTEPNGGITQRIMQAHSLISIPHFQTPLWLEIVALILSLMMVQYHWNEWKHRRQNFEIPIVAERLLLQLDSYRTSGSNVCTDDARQRFLDKLMNEMKARLGSADKVKVEFSIMVPNGRGELATYFIYPQNGSMQGNLTLKTSEGAAGAAYTSGRAIYVPSTKHRIGISVDENRTIGPIYKPDPAPTPVRCLFCAPILNKGGVSGVFNIVCTKRSAFSSFQMNVGKLMAAIISTIG